MSLLSRYLLKNLERFKNNKCINNTTYNEIYELSKFYRHQLQSLKPQDRVCINAPKSKHWISLMIAVWEKNGIFIPLPNLNENYIKKCKPNFIIQSCIHKPVDISTKLISTSTDIRDNQIATFLFTSGSSGDPKGVVLSHDNIMNNIQMINHLYGNVITSKDRSFSLLPWYHCYGLVCELLYLLGKGSQINIPKNQEDPIKMFKEIKWNHPTILFTVPKILERVKKMDNKYIPNKIKKRLVWGKDLRMMSVGGSQCDKDTIQFIEDTYKIRVYQGYGMTELSPMISLNSESHNKIGSVGKPLRNVKISIGENNEIIVNDSPSLMIGYLSSIDEKNNTIISDPFNKQGYQTGDKGYIDDDGYLFVNGRLKHEYKLLNGKYVNPIFLEHLILSECKQIHQIIIFPSKNNDSNECLFYLSDNKAKDNIILQIFQILKNKGVKQYEIPKKYYMMKEPFSLQNNLLSLKFEPRREIIIDKFYRNELMFE